MRRVLLLIGVLFLATPAFADKPFAQADIKFANSYPRLITKLSIPVTDSTAHITQFLSHTFLPLFNLPSDARPVHLRTQVNNAQTIYRFAYTYHGIPVENAITSVAVSKGKIYRIVNSLPAFTINTTPSIPESEAVKSLLPMRKNTAAPFSSYRTALVILPVGPKVFLAYKVRFTPSYLGDARYYYVDAHTGRYLLSGTDTRYADSANATVFEYNPKRTPTPITLELPWLGDDVGGFLTAGKDENGYRLVAAANCPDKGEINEIQGYRIPICTAEQIANRDTHGNFIYDDWTNGVNYIFDDKDIYAEVSAYYHISKIYGYLQGLNVPGFHYLNGYQTGPIIGIVNFQMGSRNRVRPMDNAFYTPYDPSFYEIYLPHLTLEGELIVLGQGETTDFGYDGDVIYHEFGHAVVNSTAHLSYLFADQYGFTIAPMALNEGIADSFTFLLTGDPCLAEYVSEGISEMAEYEKYGDFYCMRYAANDQLIQETQVGESHHDGLPVVAANWAIYNFLLEKGVATDDFSRFFLNILTSLQPDSDYLLYAETFLSECEANTLCAPYLEDIRNIFDQKNFFEPVRARDFASAQILMTGGISDYSGLINYFVIDDEGFDTKIAPAYLQTYYTMPHCTNTLTISANTQETSYYDGPPSLEVYVRKDQPVEYDYFDYPVTVYRDKVVYKESYQDAYIVKNLEQDTKYYFQFINKGGEGVIYNISIDATWEGDKECEENPDEDTYITDDTDTVSDETSSDTDTEISSDTDIQPLPPVKNDGCGVSVL